MNLIDLTHVFEQEMPVFPGMPSAVIEKICSVEDHGYNLRKINIFTHMGTHIDCPSHVHNNGASITDKDVNSFFGDGIVIDCSHLAKGEEIGLDIIQQYNLTGKDFLLIYTGWDKHWRGEQYLVDFPVISNEVANFINDTDLKGIGLDVISIDHIANDELSTHQIVLGKDKIIIENLTGLEQLLDKEFKFSCLPLKIKDGDGCPVRAVAIIS